jgi:putative hemolysin
MLRDFSGENSAPGQIPVTASLLSAPLSPHPQPPQFPPNQPAGDLIPSDAFLHGALRDAPLGRTLAALVGRLLGVDELNRLYAAVSHTEAGLAFYDALLRELGVTVRLAHQDLRRIPATGPVAVVANHPFGALEGIILAWMLLQVRSDVRVMANFLLQRIPQMQQNLIAVNPFDTGTMRAENLRGLRRSVEWLRQGGALGIFPAGEVSHWDRAQRRIIDPPWNPNIARLIRQTQAAAVPVFLEGGNGLAFQLSGLLHPRLRTAQLGHQLLNKRNRPMEVRVGSPISAAMMSEAGDDQNASGLLRNRVYLLANRGTHTPERTLHQIASSLNLRSARPVAHASAAERIAAAVDSLPARNLLLDQGEFAVYLTPGETAPELLREIGRLREITFRDAGEGTGRSLDLDRFDHTYQHLFVYNHVRREVVGAYRLARVHETLHRDGLTGLYLSTLFHFEPAFFRHLGNALELGRSFVRKEYQRAPAPLMLLWKGIGKVVVREPSCPRLLGPVSISNEYTHGSRKILVDTLRRLREDSASRLAKLGQFVRPRKPFAGRRVMGWDEIGMRFVLGDLDGLSALVSDLESDGKGIPVLLRQYLRLGGHVLAFNVDPQFAHTLDGLMVLDLRETDRKTLIKYLGKDGAQAIPHVHPGGAGGTAQ